MEITFFSLCSDVYIELGKSKGTQLSQVPRNVGTRGFEVYAHASLAYKKNPYAAFFKEGER